MKKTLTIVFICAILVIVFLQFNAEPEISEEEALSSVIVENSHDTGKVDILSISKRWGNYIIEWENEENCERGTNTVDGHTAETIRGEVTLC
ncbi:hypothetical protein ACE1TF_19425 [Geomicrobium sp. JSM 1781026]|uniref:hypothetical protein n=1 Tax=Geomicrobium sp. JSM 1781026 TaxID=3344580 RepID=UPI0035C1009F